MSFGKYHLGCSVEWIGRMVTQVRDACGFNEGHGIEDKKKKNNWTHFKMLFNVTLEYFFHPHPPQLPVPQPHALCSILPVFKYISSSAVSGISAYIFPTHFPFCSVFCLPQLAIFYSSFKFHFFFIFPDLPRTCHFSFDTLIDLYPLFGYMHCMLLFFSSDLLFHSHMVACEVRLNRCQWTLLTSVF